MKVNKNPKRSKSYESLCDELQKSKGRCMGNFYDSDSGITPASVSLSDVYLSPSSDSLWEVPTVMKIRKYLESMHVDENEEHEDMAGGDTARSIKEKYSMRKMMYRKLIDFCQCWLREKGLFPKTYCQDSKESLLLEKPQGLDDDIFVKGFKLGNIESLQKFLVEEKKLLDEIAQQPTFSTSVSSTTIEVEAVEPTITMPSTHIPPPSPVQYLMPEGYSIPSYELPCSFVEEEYLPPPTEEYWHSNLAVRKAQLYFRQNKVFQFFNYLAAMLVSSVPGRNKSIMMTGRLSNENEKYEIEGEYETEIGERTSSESTEEKVGKSDVSEMKPPFERLLKIPKILSKELINKIMAREPLFKTIYTSDSFTDLLPDEKAEKLASVLVSGFGLKNLQQLQEALEADKTVKSKKTEAEQFPCICSEESSEKSEPLPPPIPPQYSIDERVRYLLQLEEYIELEGEMGSIPPPPVEEEVGTEIGAEFESHSPMEKAKRYLREHKVFQFFQFLVSHLLSAVPEDPIDFLMTLLDRVLLYRTGLLSPPLLYEKKHIEQLFHLMDRFGQGYVDLQQYKTAMETFGICSYNKRPILNHLSMVSREVFVEEIFSAELAMFNDLIKSRVSCTCDLTAPPPTIIDLDLKTQSTVSVDNSIQSIQFKHVVPVEKFWEKHGDKQPKAFKGKFWSEFVREAQRRDSERKNSEQTENEGKPLL